MNILVVAGNEKQKKELEKIFSASENKIVSPDEAHCELQKGGYDYVMAPREFISLRTAPTAQTEEDIKKRSAEKITELFLSRGGELRGVINAVKNDVRENLSDAARAESALCEIYKTAAKNVFSRQEWLELYLSHDLCEGTSAHIAEQLITLYREYAELFLPVSNDKTEEVILYILNNPESDLRQKTIASKMYVNSSYLSTVFAAQTGVRFVDYLTSVKLRRAAYLLMNSALNISEIASRLDYKDIGYFSRLFKARYGIPPSQYRIPDNYTYEI